MSLSFWETIVSINQVLKPLRETQTPQLLAMTDLLDLRSKLRAYLLALRDVISEQYTERDAYQVLFPLIAHCDELIKLSIQENQQLDWPPLQMELYQVANAGDLFFEQLESALKQSETLGLVYEVFYFCLRDGFCGRYSGNPMRLNDYCVLLRQHIRVQPFPSSGLSTTPVNNRSHFRIPYYFYWVTAIGLLISVYFFLVNLASGWQPS
jgi:type IV/VI secretion system ImpK/VasF family protein